MTKRDIAPLWPLLVPAAGGLMWLAGLLGVPYRLALLLALAGVCVAAVVASWWMWGTL